MRPNRWAVVLLAGALAGPATAEDARRCQGLAEAVTKRDSERLAGLLAAGCDPKTHRGMDPLALAVALGNVDAVKRLLDAGADPNAADAQGVTITQRLGSAPRVADADALEVARLLDHHHCTFEPGHGRGPRLVTNLAPRRLPRTLAFLLTKPSLGSDPTEALQAIARSDDLESVTVLLEAGADVLEGVALRSALGDAAAAGQTPSVKAMVKRVKDLTAPKVLAAYRLAAQNGHVETAQAFLDAGVKPPAPATPKRSLCQPRELTAEESNLLARALHPEGTGPVDVAATRRCSFVQRCHELVFIDCNSAADGPAFYVDERTAKVVSTCGGACMRGCTDCPPTQWDCRCDP